MGLKIFGPGGIDQKSNTLLRDPKNLRDALNIRYSITKEYEKRPGTDIDSAFSGNTYSDVIFIKSLNEYFFRDGDYYYSYKDGVKKTIPLCAVNPTSDNVSTISGAEYLNTFIFTHQNGQTGTFKYDGNSIYLAGLPVPQMSVTAGVGTACYVLSFFDFIDNQGNEIFGPSLIQRLDSLAFIETVSVPKVDGFYGGYISVAGSPGVQDYVLSASNRTISYTAKSSDIAVGTKVAVRTVPLSRFAQIECLNTSAVTMTIGSPGFFLVNTTKDMVVGQTVSFSTTGTLPTGVLPNTVYYVRSINSTTQFEISATPFGASINTSGTQSGTHTSTTDKKSFYNYILLEVESLTGSTITFTQASFKGSAVNITSNASLAFNIMANLSIRNYVSLSETTGYVQNSSLDCFVIDNSGATSDGGVTLSTDSSVSPFLLSNVYDITTSKLRPPKCKYIEVFGYQLAYGNVLSFWDFKNKETTYTNNDLVMYSDVLTGDLGENLSEINRQLIGNTYDGDITGMIRAKDSLIVFKNKSIYALDGVLVSGLFSVRKIETNEVGCTSYKSLLVIDGGVLFQGIDGIYSISGNSAVKVSGRIDPFFTNEVNSNFNNIVFDSSKTRSIVDNLNESYYFFTNKGVVVFNFEFKEWFLWDLTNSANGLTIDNSNNIKMFSGSSVKKFIASKNDSGSEITAWIKTSWFDFGEPSLLKKFIDIRYFSLNNAGQILESKIYRDWDESKVKDAFDIDMSLSSTKTILRKLDIQQAQSISLFIGNNFVDEDLNLTGFELNGGVIQEVDKNV